MKITKIPQYFLRFVDDANFRFSLLRMFGVYNGLDDERYLMKAFKAAMGKHLNLENPETFNEKLQWLKLYDRRPEYTMFVDKYRVRDYIASELGREYLIPLLGVWNRAEDIDFDTLPNRFVLKCNHNSGLGMYICEDKSKLSDKDIKRIKRNLNKGLRQNYYLTGREWPYKDVPRKIIAEQYMEVKTIESSGNDSVVPTSTLSATNRNGLPDYKVHVFNGKARFILVCSQRFSATGVREDFFDLNWNHLGVKRPAIPLSEVPIPKPTSFDKMIEFAERLASGIPFVRIDFYDIDGTLKFGEMTFFPASGMEAFEPESFDITFGQWLSLPSLNG